MLCVPGPKGCIVLAESPALIPCTHQFAGSRLNDLHLRRRGPVHGGFHLLFCSALRMGFRRQPSLHVRLEFLSAGQSRRMAVLHHALSTRTPADYRV